MDIKGNLISYGLMFVMVSIPGSIYHYYNHYLFSDKALDITVNDAVADAISQSGRNDLEISDITGLSCLDRTRDPKSKTHTYDCAAMAHLSDGKSTPICITRTKHYKSVKKRRYSSPKRVNKAMDVTVSFCGIDNNIKGSSQISRKWFF